MNHPAAVNALAKQRRLGSKSDLVGENSNYVHPQTSGPSCRSTSEASRLHLPEKSSTTCISNHSDTGGKRRRPVSGGDEYCEEMVSRALDKKDFAKKRKYEEEYSADSKKQKCSSSLGVRDRTAKRIVDKCHGSSVVSSTQKEKCDQRTGDLRNKILGRSHKNDVCSVDKENRKTKENKERKTGEKENIVKKDKQYERNKKTKSVSKTDKRLNRNEKYHKSERKFPSNKAKSQNLDSRCYQSHQSPKKIDRNSQDRYNSADSSPPRNSNQNRKHSEDINEYRHSQRQGGKNSKTNKKTNEVSKSEGKCTDTNKSGASDVITVCPDSDRKCKMTSNKNEVPVTRRESEKEHHEEKETATEQLETRKECGVYKVIEKWNTDTSADGMEKLNAVLPQSTAKLHIWQRSQSGKRLLLKSIKENVLDVSQIRTKEFPGTVRLSSKSTCGIDGTKQLSETVCAKNAVDVSGLEGRLNGQTVCEQVNSAVGSVASEKVVTENEYNIEDMNIIDEVGSDKTDDFENSSLTYGTCISKKKLLVSHNSSVLVDVNKCDVGERNGEPMSLPISPKVVRVENIELGICVDHTILIPQELVILGNAVEQKNCESHADKSMCTEGDDHVAEAGNSTSHLSPKPIRMNDTDKQFHLGNCVQPSSTISQEVSCIRGVSANVEQGNGTNNALHISPNIICRENDDSSHTAPTSSKPIIVKPNHSPEKTCDEGANQGIDGDGNGSHVSQVSVKSVDLPNDEHGEEALGEHPSGKELSLQVDAHGVEQEHRASNSPVDSANRRGINKGGHTEEGINTSPLPTVGIRDRIENGMCCMLTSSDKHTQYAPGASPSHSKQDTAIKEFSSETEMAVKIISKEIMDIDSSQESVPRKNTEPVIEMEAITKVSASLNLRSEGKENNGCNETQERCRLNSSILKCDEYRVQSSNTAQFLKPIDSNVWVSKNETACNRNSNNNVDQCSADLLIPSQRSSNDAEHNTQLILKSPSNDVQQKCHSESKIISNVQANVTESLQMSLIPDVPEVSSALESLEISDTKNDHNPLSIIVSIPKSSIVGPLYGSGSHHCIEDSGCAEDWHHLESNRNNDLAAGNTETDLDSDHSCVDEVVKEKHTPPSASVCADKCTESQDVLEKESEYVLHEIENVPRAIKSWKSKLDELKNSGMNLYEYKTFLGQNAVTYKPSKHKSVLTSTPKPKPLVSAITEKLIDINHLTFNESAIMCESFSDGHKHSEISDHAVTEGKDGVMHNVEMQNNCAVESGHKPQPLNNLGDIMCSSEETTVPYLSEEIKRKPVLPDYEISCSGMDSKNLNSLVPVKGNALFTKVPKKVNDWAAEIRNADVEELPIKNISNAYPSRYADCDDSRASFTDDVHIIQVYLFDSDSSTTCETVENNSENKTYESLGRDTFTEDHACDKPNEDNKCSTSVEASDKCVESGAAAAVVENGGLNSKNSDVCKSSFKIVCDQLDRFADIAKIKAGPIVCDSTSVSCSQNIHEKHQTILLEDTTPDESVLFSQGCARTRMFNKSLKSDNAVNNQPTVDSLAETVRPKDLNASSVSNTHTSREQSPVKKHPLNKHVGLFQTIKSSVLTSCDTAEHEKDTINLKENKHDNNVNHEIGMFSQCTADLGKSVDVATGQIVSQTKDDVSTSNGETSDDTDSSGESASSDDPDTSSESDSDLDELDSFVSGSSSIHNLSKHTVKGSGELDESDVSEDHEAQMPTNNLFGKMQSNEHNNRETAQKAVCSKSQILKNVFKNKLSKIGSSLSNTNDENDEMEESVVNHTTGTSFANKNNSACNEGSSVYNEEGIEYPSISMDAEDCCVQLQLNSDEKINESCLLEDGEISTDTLINCSLNRQLCERKANTESLVKLKMSNTLASVVGQPRGQRKGTQLSMNLHRPSVGGKHVSQASRECGKLSTIKEYKRPQTNDSDSKKRTASHFNTMYRPKRKRFDEKPSYRTRIDSVNNFRKYPSHTGRMAFSHRKTQMISPIKSKRRIPRTPPPRRPVRQPFKSFPVSGQPVKWALEKGPRGYGSRNDRPIGPRTPPEVKPRNDDHYSNRYSGEVSERCRRNSGDRIRRNHPRTPSPHRGHIKDDHSRNHTVDHNRVHSSHHPYRRRSMDCSPLRRPRGPRTPSPECFDKDEHFSKTTHRKHETENCSYSASRCGVDGAFEVEHRTPSRSDRRRERESCSTSDSDSAKYRQTKSHSPAGSMQQTSTLGHSRLYLEHKTHDTRK